MDYFWLFFHIAFGEIAALLYFFIGVCLYVNTERFSEGLYKTISKLGLVGVLLSWVSGGYYYLNHYGNTVKPAIKSGAYDWAHLVVTEVKEHIFLFIPFLALIVTVGILYQIKSTEIRKGLGVLAILTFLMGMSMALMGFFITLGYRVALEGGV